MDILNSVNWTEVLLTLCQLVMVPIVAAVVQHLNAWLEAKRVETEKKTESEAFNKYFTLAQNLSREVVDYLNVTLVNDLKVASEDGKLTSQEAEMIMMKGKNAIMTSLGEAGVGALTSAFGDLDRVLEILITNATEQAKLPSGDRPKTGLTASQAKSIAFESHT